MTSYGQQICNYLNTPGLTLDDQLTWVDYDQIWVMYQIADYTGDTAWKTCAAKALAVYRDLYVLPNNGAVPGYWNFTTGLRLDYERTRNVASKQAAILLSQNAMYAADTTPLEWTVSAVRSREVAYAILSYINAEALGEPPRQRRVDLVNQAYDHFNQWFVTLAWQGTPDQFSPFMVGLTAHSLIRDWEQTHDSRLIPALQEAADYLWAHAWVPADSAMRYQLNPGDTADGGVSPSGAPDLNLLIAPLYAFLYQQTSETKYRDEGDQIFSGGVLYAWLGGGKQFDQNYSWSFDYIKWLTLPPLTSPQP